MTLLKQMVNGFTYSCLNLLVFEVHLYHQAIASDNLYRLAES